MTPLEAHLVCLALAASDIIARALRLRPILRGLRAEVPFSRLVALTLACDAACALTPYRAGGDAARLAALRRAGVPLSSGLAALLADALVTWPVVAASGSLLAACGAAVWWRAFVAGAGRMLAGLRSPGCLILLALTGTAIGAVAACGLGRRRSRGTAGEGRGLRRLSPRLLLSTLPLTVVAVASRVLILPTLLAVTGDRSYSLVATLAGSFVLLYSQLVLPLPAGVGAVDAGLLAGAPQGAGVLSVLLSWRLYTSGLGLLFGLAALPVALAAPGPRLATATGADPWDSGRNYCT